MPPRLGTLSRWGRMSDAGGAGGEEGGKEASNRGRGNTYPRRGRKKGFGNGIQQRERNSLAHRSMVGNYCKFIRAARFHLLPPPLPSDTSGFSSLRVSTSDAFSIFHSHPPPAVLGRSHRDPTLPSTARVRKPLLAKLKLRHSARNAETIWLCNLWL